MPRPSSRGRQHAGASLRERRLEAGLTQGELADRAGVSRQLVAAVETGRHAPAVDAALGLAGALSTTVEELFTAPLHQPAVSALGEPIPTGAPLRVGRVGAQLVAARLPDHGTAGAGWAVADGMWADGDVRLFPGAGAASLVLAGCEPAFGIAEQMLAGLGERSLLAISAPTGRAIEALERGRVHAAVVHAAQRRLPSPPVAVAGLHVARWQVGLAVSPRRRRASLDAILARVPIVQREAAATVQQVLHRAWAAAGITAPLKGPVAGDHLGVARLAAALGTAGITTESAALAFGLRFLPFEEHVVELWIDRRWQDHPGASALSDLLHAGAFTQRVAHRGGYDLAGCGQSIDRS